MTLFILGLVLFFAPHALRMVAPGLRDRLLTRMGEGGYKGLYSLVSLAGIVLIVIGWMQIRPEMNEVYDTPSWGRHATSLLVLLGFIGIMAANFPTGYIKKLLQHPFLTGIFLWALGHLLANGDMGSLILFGVFALYALLNRLAVMARPVPAMGAPRAINDLYAVIGGGLLYAIFAFWLHGVLFGVSPF